MFTNNSQSKSRETPGPSVSMRWVRFAPANPLVATNTTAGLGGIQITESEGNPWPTSKKKSGLTDIGSEFYTQKKEILPSQGPFTSLYFKKIGDPANLPFDSYVEGRYMLANAFGSTGLSACGASPPNFKLLRPNWPPDMSSSRSSLNVKGAIAVAACAPTNMVAEAASAVGELIQAVPAVPGAALWKSRLRAAEVLAGSADEFLNGIFGILPTISDMTDFTKGVHAVDKRVDQFIRDSGRVVRRSYYFPKERTIEETVLSNDENSPFGYKNGDNAAMGITSRYLPSYQTVRTRVIEREIWFKGAFTYHIPEWFDSHSKEDRMKLSAKLLGAEPDLNTLWQLAPWSWAVDWFVNAGSYIKTLQALISYGLVMRYGYVMEKTTVTDTYSAGQRIPPLYNKVGVISPPYPPVVPVQLRVTTKKRVQAHPFGFGVSWDGLSTVQRAIVTALGITRVVR